MYTFCKNEKEFLEHLLFYCDVIDSFWKELLSWITTFKEEVKEISPIDELFGKFNIEKDVMAINHIFVLAKFYIFGCKRYKINPSIDVFIT